MDGESHELAKTGLEVYSSQLTPFYQELRERLVGRLATNEIDLERLRSHDTLEQNNFSLVAQFVDGLPRAQNARYSDALFYAKDAYEARQIEANVLSLYEAHSIDGRFGTRNPYYIIGRRPKPQDGSHPTPKNKPPASQLLLYSALRNAHQDPIRIITVWDDEFEYMTHKANRGMHLPYNKDELVSRFDTHSGNLKIWPVMKTGLTTVPDYLGRTSRRRDFRKKVDQNGIHASKTWGKFDERFTDRLLADFDVFDHLNHLATAFGKVDNLADLINRYKLLIPEDIDAILLEES